MTKKSILGVLVTLLLLAGVSLGQAIPGVGTRVANGPTLPTNAGQYTMFVLTTGTPTLYICNNNPCMVSGDWVASGGGGGGGGGANTALSNLSSVAINGTLAAASGVTLTLSGFNGTSGASATGVLLEGGAAFLTATNGGPVNISSGAAPGLSSSGYSGASGVVNLSSGAAGSNNGNTTISGNVNIFSGASAGASGNVSIYAGLAQVGTGGAVSLTGGSTYSGNGGQASVSGGNAVGGSGLGGGVSISAGTSLAGVLGTVGISGDIITLNAVNGSSPGEIYVQNGNFYYGTDDSLDFDVVAHRPRDAYFGRNVYAAAFAASGSSAPLAQGTAAWNAQGLYSGTPSSQSGQQTVSFIAGGGLGYSFNGGGVNTLANLTSNISGQAGTALALAATPVQCPANATMTGIAANGNCNSTVLNTIAMQEVGAQTSASGQLVIYGSTSTHGPTYTENGSSPAPLGAYPNLFNADTGSGGGGAGNVLEESAGATTQSFRVYHTTDGTSYERMGMFFDTVSSDMAIASEWGGSPGSTPNLGFAVGSAPATVRWEIPAFSPYAFRPQFAQDDIADLGDNTHRIYALYAGGPLNTSVKNASSTGTTLNKLAKLTGAPATAVLASTSDTGGMIGVVMDGAGTTGNAAIARAGIATCVFDATATVAGDYVQISSSVAGDCTDAGSTYPTSGQILGRVLSTHGSGGGTYAMTVMGGEVQGVSAGGTVTSVATGTGLTGGPITGSGTISLSPAAASVIGGVESITSAAHNWVSYIDTSGVPHQSQPTLADIAAGVAPSGTFDFTGATPKVPNQTVGNSSTNAANTAYVMAQAPNCTAWMTEPNETGSVTAFVQNKAQLWGIELPCNLTTSKFEFYVVTTDNSSNLYDLGLVNSAGTVVAHTGATAGSTLLGASNGVWVSATISGAPVTIPPGKLYVAITTNCSATCAVLGGWSSFVYVGNAQANTTSGGSLTSGTITIPSDTFTTSVVPSFAFQ